MRILVLFATLALLALAVPGASAAPEAVCVPTSGGGLDYHSEACVDAGNDGCRAWHDQATDGGVRRTCYVPV